MADYTPITIIRGDSEVIDSTPIVDGQILFDSDRKCLYADVSNSRTKYSGLGADANIAEVEDTTTSTHDYVRGQYVIVQGEFYEVTAPISVGDTFAVGTNIAETTVGTELAQMNATFSQTLASLKATAIAQAVGVTISDTFAQVIAKLGAIINRGKVTKALTGGETYTIPQGYHNGQGTVSAPAQTGTYSATARGAAIDMGATNTYRYVNTTNVPNTNSQIYGTITANGRHDMGNPNYNRYVDVSVPPYIAYYDEWHDTGEIGGDRAGMNMGFSVTNGALYVVTRWVSYGSQGDAWARASFSGGDIIQDLSVRDAGVASCRMWIVRATSNYFSYNCSVNDSAGARRMIAIRIG